jgi:hypothetical protein
MVRRADVISHIVSHICQTCPARPGDAGRTGGERPEVRDGETSPEHEALSHCAVGDQQFQQPATFTFSELSCRVCREQIKARAWRTAVVEADHRDVTLQLQQNAHHEIRIRLRDTLVQGILEVGSVAL